MMLNTLGEVITCAIALIALIVVPAGIIRAWFPVIRERVGGVLMSRSGDGSRGHSASFDSGSQRFAPPVFAQQNQENQNQNATIDDIIDLTYTSPLTDQQAITILALMRRENGDYFLSANKIRDIVGGADATVKAEVAALRPKEPTPPPLRSITRPPGGWPSKVS
jgi:hypothetical protein